MVSFKNIYSDMVEVRRDSEDHEVVYISDDSDADEDPEKLEEIYNDNVRGWFLISVLYTLEYLAATQQ